MPSSAMVLAPVHARIPPTSHTTSAAPGDGTLVSMDPGEVKMPLPMTMLITMEKASTAPRLRVKVPAPPSSATSSGGMTAALGSGLPVAPYSSCVSAKSGRSAGSWGGVVGDIFSLGWFWGGVYQREFIGQASGWRASDSELRNRDGATKHAHAPVRGVRGPSFDKRHTVGALTVSGKADISAACCCLVVSLVSASALLPFPSLPPEASRPVPRGS